MRKIVLLGCNDKTRALVPILCKDAGIASEICIASRDKAKCDEIRDKYKGGAVRISTARVDLSNESGTRMMLTIAQPDMLVNLTEASFSTIIMKLCLEIGVPYVDGSLFDIGSSDLLSKQFEFFGDFRSKKLTAVVGCDFNPGGITTIVRNALEEDFDTIESADIIEAGNQVSSKKMNIKELLESKDVAVAGAKAVYLNKGVRTESEPLKIKVNRQLPGSEVPCDYYAMSNTIVEDFLKELPDVPTVRYFSTTSKPDTSILDELSKFGLLSKEPIEIEGVKIAPLDFISKLLETYEPDDKSDSESSNMTIFGEGMAVILSGKKNGTDKTIMIHVADMVKANAYAVASAIRLVATNKWSKAGVFTPCAFEPSMMLDSMKRDGFYLKSKEVEPLDVITEA